MSGAVGCGLGETTDQGDKKFIESSFRESERSSAFVPTLPQGIKIVCVCVRCVALPFMRKNNSVFPVCLTSRAEEEDEHLERTLEQNKGKMAKKEEKCALQ